MAKKSLSGKTTPETTSTSDLYGDLVARYTQSNTFFQKKRNGWEDSEKLFNSVRADSTTDSGLITDGSLTTLIIERAARLSAQLQTGRVKEVGNTHSACAVAADLIFQNDILKNANSGNPLEVKLFQVLMGADIYGTYPVMYGLNVTEDNAFADFWLVKPQLYYPQPGKITPFDMQWAQVETTVTVSQLKGILKNDATNWDKDAINKLIKELKEGAAKEDSNDVNKTTYGERTNYDRSQISGKGDYAPVTLRTEYQSGSKGHWITYAPGHSGIVLRDVPNPHKNGKIPIVHCTAIPQFDELYGISTMDRGKSVQKTIDSFTNLGYQNALLNVYPITKVKTDAVINSTLEMKAGATWRMSDLNAVAPYSTGNTPVEYFQTSISSMRSILLNQNGTTDTMQNAQSSNDPSFGKTKSAIDLRNQKQNARDSLSVRMYDIFYEELASGLIDVKLNCATKPVQINLDQDHIQELQQDKDVKKLIEVDGNTVTIALGPLKKGNYKYEVDPGSSIEADDSTEHDRLSEIIPVINNSPQLLQMAQAEGYDISAGALIQRWITSSGTSKVDEIIHKKSDEEIQADQQMAAEQQAQMQQQQPQDPGQDPNAQPQQDMGQPPQPQDNLHPFVQHLAQDPEGAMGALQGGQY